MTTATDSDALTLAQWLSPAFPVGAFAYAHGLEWAVEAGDVRNAKEAGDWIADILDCGAGRADAILLAEACGAADAGAVRDIDAVARALAPSSERLKETVQQGQAFCRTIAEVWGHDLEDLCYPVALGRAARLHGLPLTLTMRMYLQAFAANLVSAAIRLVPLGQTDGQRIVSALAPLCARIAARAETQTLDDIASSAFLGDIASMKHETQGTRLFVT